MIKKEIDPVSVEMLDRPIKEETDEETGLYHKVNDLYACSYCELLFSTESIAEEHELVRHSKKINKCKLCDLEKNCSHILNNKSKHNIHVKHFVHVDDNNIDNNDDTNDNTEADDTELRKDVGQRPWQKKGPNQVQLFRGFFVFIDAKKLKSIEKKKNREPSQLVSVLMREIVGKARLKKMSLTGRGGKQEIPKDVINAVMEYTTNKIPNKVLTKAKLHRCMTVLCRNMRRAKE